MFAAWRNGTIKVRFFKGHGGGSEAYASFRGCIAANGEAKGRGGTFFLYFVLQGDRYSPLLDEWTFWRGERGEMLDERVECPNETVSFILLNLEDDFLFVLRFLNPAGHPLPFGLPCGNIYLRLHVSQFDYVRRNVGAGSRREFVKREKIVFMWKVQRGGVERGENLAEKREMETFSTMRKRMLGTMGWLLMALLLLPVGAMAQTAKEKVRVTAGVFDSYDNTFVRDEYGVPKNQRTHEKGGELWVEYDGKNIPAASFNQEVEEGTELTFKVKLAKGEQGDRGEMLDFGASSEWWEVLEWRVNGKVQPGRKDSVFTYKVPKAKSVHVGVRFQRRKFLVKVVYHHTKPNEAPFSDPMSGKPAFENGEVRPYDRGSALSLKSKNIVLSLSLNGVYLGKLPANTEMLSDYQMEGGDVFIEANVLPSDPTSRRYVLVNCIGDGEWVQFQVNTKPLNGGSRFPVSGEAVNKPTVGRDFGVRPYGIRPNDLSQAKDTFLVQAKAKQGSRLAAVLIDGARVYDMTFRTPENESRFVQGVFVKEGKQVLILSAVGKKVLLKVTRGKEELSTGDAVLPGDRLRVEIVQPQDPTLISWLRVNGVPIASGDEWLVQGNDDVLVELMSSQKSKIWGNPARSMLQYEIEGEGRIDVTNAGGTRHFASGELLYEEDAPAHSDERICKKSPYILFLTKVRSA